MIIVAMRLRAAFETYIIAILNFDSIAAKKFIKMDLLVLDYQIIWANSNFSGKIDQINHLATFASTMDLRFKLPNVISLDSQFLTVSKPLVYLTQ